MATPQKALDDAVTTVRTGTMPLLETTDLRISLLQNGQLKTVVDGVSYRLDDSKTLAIVGESGSGKTLSCRALLGLLPRGAIVSGTARFAGRNLLKDTERELRNYRGSSIGMIFQDPVRSLNPTMRVGHQIAETIRAHEHVSWRFAKMRSIELLRLLRFAKPEQAYFSYAHELSGGMQQRVTIAIALAGNPRLLIADEATRSLDTRTQAQTIELLRHLQSQLNMAIIMISHDLKLAAAIADDVLVMQAGRAVEYAPTEMLFQRPQMPYTRALLEAANSHAGINGTKYPSDRCAATVTTPEPAPLLKVCNLFQSYNKSAGPKFSPPGTGALFDVSFVLNRGEALGLVGESGSGKSTLARTLLQEPRPISGSVVLNGVDLTKLPHRELVARRRDMQAVFQDPCGSLNPKWCVFSIVEEPLTKRFARPERHRRVVEALSMVGLPAATFGQRRPRSLSGGQCQRVAIARAIVARPQLIILDEALSSLDALIQSQVLDLLQRLRNDLGLAYLFISHDLTLVESVCDRVGVMHAGVLCEIGDTKSIFQSPNHPHTAALMVSRLAAVKALNFHGHAGDSDV